MNHYFNLHLQSRQRYQACKTALRDILSKYLNGADPSDLAFYKNQYGKPFLKQSISADIKFNVTHTGDIGLVAVSSREVGIDVEKRTRHISNIHRIINSRLTTKEKESLLINPSNLSPEQLEEVLRERFLLMWTRKEAFLKCSGEGIKRGLKSFEIDRFEHDPRLLSVDHSKDKALQWAITNVDVDLDHFGSVVYQSESQLPITCYEYK